ncbi:hypothetical protein GCM10009839_32990 [Catenulispora yoronensis]|uniref:Uncharacterized protein n=1 Tax=Catenulispora yoronensis TaxID=450799 RepID=A0ABN2U852_9ACTN
MLLSARAKPGIVATINDAVPNHVAVRTHGLCRRFLSRLLGRDGGVAVGIVLIPCVVAIAVRTAVITSRTGDRNIDGGVSLRQVTVCEAMFTLKVGGVICVTCENGFATS